MAGAGGLRVPGKAPRRRVFTAILGGAATPPGTCRAPDPVDVFLIQDTRMAVPQRTRGPPRSDPPRVPARSEPRSSVAAGARSRGRPAGAGSRSRTRRDVPGAAAFGGREPRRVGGGTPRPARRGALVRARDRVA